MRGVQCTGRTVAVYTVLAVPIKLDRSLETVVLRYTEGYTDDLKHFVPPSYCSSLPPPNKKGNNRVILISCNNP